MEKRRKELAEGGLQLFPARRDNRDVISVTSSSSSNASSPQTVAPPKAHRRQIAISSDEEDEIDMPAAMPVPKPFQPSKVAGQYQTTAPFQPVRMPVPEPYKPQMVNVNTPSSNRPLTDRPENLMNPSLKPYPAGKPIHIPSNKDFVAPRPADNPNAQNFETFPDLELKNTPDNFLTPAETEKALRDLMGSGINDDAQDVEINPEDQIVEGFKDEIRLLPHQVIGRAWMKEREDVTTKKTGGILADDMGLGKTIQTITRIVEGKPRMSDKSDGWSGSTLVVCPVALVGQWASEIKKVAKRCKVIQHHGANRTTDPKELMQANVVITTYSTLASENLPSAKDESKQSKSKSKKKTNSSEDSNDSGSDSDSVGKSLKSRKTKKAAVKNALFQVKWWRVVLDEAHNIKNRTTKAAVACCELEAKFRWCLTGTPLQNNADELYSLIKFLRIRPLNDWAKFREQISQPIKTGKGAGRAMKRLQVVLKTIMLRRKKNDMLNGKELITLPPRKVEVVHCVFDESEKAFYNALENKVEDTVDKLRHQEKKANYTSVLLLLLRLRQACNHPCLVSKDYKADKDALEPKTPKSPNEEEAEDDELAGMFGKMGVSGPQHCQVCQDELNTKNAAQDPWDQYCKDCAVLAMQAKLHGERPDSAKIRMIMKILKEIDERSECGEKTIIFSQFTSMLDLIEPFLRQHGMNFTRYDGSMNPVEREKSLAKIRESEPTRIILISFKAGSTGLNLTACNNVILVDLWWNPALEEQAFDRCHRYGQTRDVNIFKLTIEKTVEDRILMLQEKKRELAKAALSGDKIKNMRLGMDDLLALFRPGRDEEDD